jgi:prevent-host-death family protein
MRSWQSSVARGRLSRIIDEAVAGKPQFIQRRDGKEVVVVSRDSYERMQGGLKTFLLDDGYAGPGEAAFDAIMVDIRATTDAAFLPRRPPNES